MINAPLYGLGDSIVLTGDSNSSSASGYSYYYNEYQDGLSNGASVSESYTYSSTGRTDYSEQYTYYSDDGTTVDRVSNSYTAYLYDSAGRIISYTSQGGSEYYNATGATSTDEYSNVDTYVYTSAAGYELDSSTTAYSSSYFDGATTYASTTTTTSSYAYTAASTGTFDYSQRRDVITTDEDSNGTLDYTNYRLFSRTEEGTSTISAQYNPLGEQTVSSISTNTSTASQDGTTQLSTDVSAGDIDGDGIINFTTMDSLERVYNSEGELLATNQESSYKSDYDDDGIVDYVYITKESRNQTSAQLIELTWNSNGPRPATLSIGISKDTDGDYSWDSTRNFSFAFGKPPASWTDMGDHVATVDDTLIA